MAAERLFQLNILLTALFAGFLTSYCVVLGRYFNYLLSSDQTEGFTRYYRAFRETSSAKALYGLFMVSQTVVALASLLLNGNSRPLAGQLLAVACLPLLFAVHRATGFARAEEAINSGREVTSEHSRAYLRLNLPLHISYSLMYALAAWLLLINR